MGSTAAAPFAWSPITAGDAGFAADFGDRIDAVQRNAELRRLHGLLVARRGRLALERYYAGVDETWGRPLGQVAFGPDTLHDLRDGGPRNVARNAYVRPPVLASVCRVFRCPPKYRPARP
jgi:hypothetical protein